MRREPARSARRGVALVIVMAAISVLTVLLAELQDESSSETAAALADRDALKAEYVARSGINLSRLLIATEPTIRTSLAPIMMIAMGGSAQIPVWEFAGQVLSAFNDSKNIGDFSSLAGVDVAEGKNLGMKGARFDVMIIDEDSKINVNLAARGDAVTQQRLAMQLLGLMNGEQYNPLFENRDADGQFSDRAAICSAIMDWADFDENASLCDPYNAQAQNVLPEDTFYQALKAPYRRKNAAYDSIEEMHLVRGVSEDFYATFVDPNASNPKSRMMTVWGQGTVNFNSANAQTLLALICAYAKRTPPQPLCTDPAQMASFLTMVGLVRTFASGVPLFSSPKAFLRVIQGKGPMGGLLKTMFNIDPVEFFSEAEAVKALAPESKVFSIYADGIVPGYKRTTKVRIHAVVDFRNAPPPGMGFAGIPMASPSGSGAPPGAGPQGAGAGPQGAGAGPQGTAGQTGADAAALAGALAPNPGGTIIYYRIE